MRAFVALALLLAASTLVPAMPPAVEEAAWAGTTTLRSVGSGHAALHLAAPADLVRVDVLEPLDVTVAVVISGDNPVGFENNLLYIRGPGFTVPPGFLADRPTSFDAGTYHVYTAAPNGMAVTVVLTLQDGVGSSDVALEPWTASFFEPRPLSTLSPGRWLDGSARYDITWAAKDAPGRSVVFRAETLSQTGPGPYAVDWLQRISTGPFENGCGNALVRWLLLPGEEDEVYVRSVGRISAAAHIELQLDTALATVATVRDLRSLALLVPLHADDDGYGADAADEVLVQTNRGVGVPSEAEVVGLALSAACTQVPPLV